MFSHILEGGTMQYRQLAFVLLSTVWLACSTMSFLPREGTPAKFNLATVNYVEARIQGQQEELARQLMETIEPILDSLLVDDRAQLARLDSLLSVQQAQVNSLSMSVDSSYAAMNAVAAKVLADVANVKRTTSDLQVISNQLSSQVENLTEETLRELYQILEQYLQSKAGVEQVDE
jgi:hypothetical protein